MTGLDKTAFIVNNLHTQNNSRKSSCTIPVSRNILVFAFFLLFFASSVYAQNKDILKRISVAKRGDNRGYVVRFAMTSPADSFVVMQPSANLIQLAIYKKNISFKKVSIHKNYNSFKNFDIVSIPSGLGINIRLKNDVYLIGNAYPDRNKHDLLLGLTTASKKDLSILTKGIQQIDWNALQANSKIVNVSSAAEKSSSDSSKMNEDPSYYALKKKIKFDVVVIDAGHGGKDPGTIGYHHIEEKNIALKVALKVGEYIKKNMPGVKVVFTRDKDVFIPLKDRGHIANRAQGDLFISIHCNSSPAHSAHGTEVYFLGLHHSKEAFEVMKRENNVVRLENNSDSPNLSDEQMMIYELANNGYMANSEKFAEMLDHQFKDRAHRHVRGIHQAGFVVLYYASMPAVLVELGFLSNPKEARYLNSKYGQTIMASAIYRAVKNYKEQFDKSQNFTNTN